MKRTHAALAATAGLVAAIALSGCSLADISPSISDLAGESVQDALNSASSALDQANQALLGAAGELDESMGELADTLRNISDVPGLLASLFSDHELMNSSSRLELVDAQTHEVVSSIDSVTDLAKLGESLSGLDVASWKLVSSVPDDYVADRMLRFYTKPTETLLGPNGDQDAEPLSITLYGEANYITMNIPAMNLTLDFELPQQDIDALGSLL